MPNSAQFTMIDASETQEFVQFSASMRLPMAPLWSEGGSDSVTRTAGVHQILSGWLMKYLLPLQAVLLSFNPTIKFIGSTSSYKSSSIPFDFDTPSAHDFLNQSQKSNGKNSENVKILAVPMVPGSGFALPTVEWQGLAWRPRVGQVVVGSSTLSTPSHISLLLHNLFNASIPSNQIPSDYIFDPDFIVPEFIRERQKISWPVVSLESNEAEKSDDEEEVQVKPDPEQEENEVEPEDEAIAEAEAKQAEVQAEEEQYKERGWWIHKITKQPLGGESGRITFTIVGLTIANSMISLTGSLLPTPFNADSSEPVPRPITIPSSRKRRQRADSNASSASESVASDAAAERIPRVADARLPTPTPVVSSPVTSTKKTKKSKAPKKEKSKK